MAKGLRRSEGTQRAFGYAAAPSPSTYGSGSAESLPASLAAGGLLPLGELSSPGCDLTSGSLLGGQPGAGKSLGFGVLRRKTAGVGEEAAA